MRVCIDLDETLCTGKPYAQAEPLPGALEFLQTLKERGHTVIIYTARCMGRTNNDRLAAEAIVADLTFYQLQAWGFPYDEVYFGKPSADLYVDDKGFSGVNYMHVLDHLELEYERRS
jgi:phosphoglycolate phosphatase-like HAD superfamily hydrolase